MVTRAVIANPNVADMIEKEVGCEKNYTRESRLLRRLA